MSAEAARYVALAANAHIDREYTPVGDTVPTIDELESLASRVERLNTEGSTTEFIDAQSEYIDALTVALEWQASRDAAELHAAQVKLATIRSIGARSGTDLNAWNKAFDVLDNADTSALAEHDKRVAAKAWDEGHEQGYDSGRYAESDDEPETVETRSLEENPYRASARQAEAKR